MKIQSVLGSIDTASLGQTLMHEHISCADWSMRQSFGSYFFNAEEVFNSSVYYVNKAKEAGVSTIVDGTPINLGRDIPLIKSVAEATGVNIIVSSGFYYQEEPWLQLRTVEELADFLRRECVCGIQNTGVLPGIMKCAADKNGVTPLISRILKATGDVAYEQNLPVFCHTAPAVHSGDEALSILMSSGLAPERIIVGHSGDTDDVDYLESLLKRGVYIGIDRFGMSDYSEPIYDPHGIELIVELIRRGWVKRLILSHDAGAKLGFGYKKEPGWHNRHDHYLFSRLHRLVIPELLGLGVSSEEINTIFVENPRRFFEGEK